jgi:shikimate dehydrogenase
VAERWAAVIGHPIGHSLSPSLFAEFSQRTGAALRYSKIDVPPEELGARLAEWKADAHFIGCNVTMPHKQAIMAHLDELTEEAKWCGAVNVVTNRGGRLVGTNTDFLGIRAALDDLVPNGGERHATLFGAGGAARACATYFGDERFVAVDVVARNPSAAQHFAHEYSAAWPHTRFIGVGFGETLAPTHVYVNATPVGMEGGPQGNLLPPNAPPDAVAFDMVYRPEETDFIATARKRGMRVVTGMTMLRRQAEETWRLWFGETP